MPQLRRIGGGQEPRRNRLLRDRNPECYRLRRKPPAPNWCPECGAVFRSGRWQWAARTPEARAETCPACLRAHDRIPAGFLRLEGAFFATHAEEILNCVRNEAEKVKADRALQRIMGIERTPERTVISTTDQHLARGLAESLRHAYKGEVDLRYLPGADVLRVTWRR